MRKKAQVSIIIVNYKVARELFNCLKSLQAIDNRKVCEIIVVDNDEIKTIEEKLKKEFPDVIYIPSKKNLGFGGGNNLGAKYAKGDFFFFLNPDTIVKKDAVVELVKFLRSNKNVGIVAPLFLDPKGKIYPQQGSEELTPLSAIVSLSFINKIFPQNPISKKYFLSNWDKKRPKKVGNVPGTAFLIRREIFKKIKGFDENFFLYFEEFDLCKRVRHLGYELFILPSARVMHFWGRSTDVSNLNIKRIFLKSKFYYFKKHYGLFAAFVVQLVTSISKNHLLLFLALILGVYLRSYKINDLMAFIGDQGWFYLSAKDFLLTGKIPLIGIASSHPWIHQGPIWTYVLSFVLLLSDFNPLSGIYLSVGIDIATIFLMYYLGKELFSEKVGIISSLLYASSPLLIILSRTPYHTSPIPLLASLLILSIVKWIRGNLNFFPIIILLLAILYNLELATAVLGGMVISLIIYGFIKNKKWVKGLLNLKFISLSLIGFLVPMFPFLLHDIRNGFPQTVKFVAWLGYRFLVLFGYPRLQPEIDGATLNELFNFLVYNLQRLLFFQSKTISIMIFSLSFAIFLILLYETYKKKQSVISFVVTFIVFLIVIVSIVITRATSDAYLPAVIPSILLIIAVGVTKLLDFKNTRFAGLFLITFLIVSNSLSLIEISKQHLIGGYSYRDRLNIAKKIVKDANGEKYNLLGKGPGSEFESFTDNYEYLTWWLGNPPSENRENLEFIVIEKNTGIEVQRIDRKRK